MVNSFKMKAAILVENISKAYQLGEIGTGTISRDLERWWAKVRRKEDPFLKIGETNNRELKGASNVVWSLNDLSFQISQGEAIGIIGKNGAGKSTLLKILSRVTSPTLGRIKIKGRIASLLEVGTGFHPELTGKENIFLNGAILGMRNKEIRKRFDEIVDFAGVERYIDTPVKRYSSGMYVRLAFAVAAHLESEILIVDEVLAVGDAEFQKKCLGKMGEVSKGLGKTVLFVSHNMSSIKGLCTKAILLSQGSMVAEGPTSDIIDKYLSGGDGVDRIAEWSFENAPKAEELYVNAIKVLDDKGRLDNILTTSDDIKIEITYTILEPVKNLRVVINLLTLDGVEIFCTSDFNFQPANKIRNPGKYTSICYLPGKLFNTGNYVAQIDFDIPKTKAVIMGLSVTFSISETSFNQLGIVTSLRPPGIIHPFLSWTIS